MLKIRVKIFAPFYGILGWNDKEFDVSTEDIGSFLKIIEGNLYDILINKEEKKLVNYSKIFLNERDIDFLEGLKTKLKDQDIMIIFSSIGGG